MKLFLLIGITLLVATTALGQADKTDAKENNRVDSSALARQEAGGKTVAIIEIGVDAAIKTLKADDKTDSTDKTRQSSWLMGRQNELLPTQLTTTQYPTPPTETTIKPVGAAGAIPTTTVVNGDGSSSARPPTTASRPTTTPTQPPSYPPYHPLHNPHYPHYPQHQPIIYPYFPFGHYPLSTHDTDNTGVDALSSFNPQYPTYLADYPQQSLDDALS